MSDSNDQSRTNDDPQARFVELVAVRDAERALDARLQQARAQAEQKVSAVEPKILAFRQQLEREAKAAFERQKSQILQAAEDQAKQILQEAQRKAGEIEHRAQASQSTVFQPLCRMLFGQES